LCDRHGISVVQDHPVKHQTTHIKTVTMVNFVTYFYHHNKEEIMPASDQSYEEK
jgi:hypothetical protein